MIKNKCEICGRSLIVNGKEIRSIIFHLTKTLTHFPHMIGEHYLVCIECSMCYNSQYYDMPNRDIQEQLNWLLKNYEDAKSTVSAGRKKE
jgi:hypothetical protein